VHSAIYSDTTNKDSVGAINSDIGGEDLKVEEKTGHKLFMCALSALSFRNGLFTCMLHDSNTSGRSR